MNSQLKTLRAWVLNCLVILAGCSAPPKTPLTTVAKVDLERFMGDWYVIASIPTFIEKGAHNAVESYRLQPDGTIATTFTFRDGDLNGPLKRYQPTGFVIDRNSKAVWGMQFIWPFKADFRIAYLNEDYTQTVIGRAARDYVWVMARTPQITETDYQKIVEFLVTQGYDVTQLQKVPQRW